MRTELGLGLGFSLTQPDPSSRGLVVNCIKYKIVDIRFCKRLFGVCEIL